MPDSHSPREELLRALQQQEQKRKHDNCRCWIETPEQIGEALNAIVPTLRKNPPGSEHEWTFAESDGTEIVSFNDAADLQNRAAELKAKGLKITDVKDDGSFTFQFVDPAPKCPVEVHVLGWNEDGIPNMTFSQYQRTEDGEKVHIDGPSLLARYTPDGFFETHAEWWTEDGVKHVGTPLVYDGDVIIQPKELRE